MGGDRCSAVANRSALHPDYYSEKKITVTPLNFVCRRGAPLVIATRTWRADSGSLQQQFHRRISARIISRFKEVPMNCGFSRRTSFVLRKSARAAPPPLYVFSHRRALAWPSLPRRKKNYAPKAFAGTFGGSSRRKTRESVQPIRGTGMFDGRAERRAASCARPLRTRFTVWNRECEGARRQPPSATMRRDA